MESAGEDSPGPCYVPRDERSVWPNSRERGTWPHANGRGTWGIRPDTASDATSPGPVYYPTAYQDAWTSPVAKSFTKGNRFRRGQAETKRKRPRTASDRIATRTTERLVADADARRRMEPVFTITLNLIPYPDATSKWILTIPVQTLAQTLI